MLTRTEIADILDSLFIGDKLIQKMISEQNVTEYRDNGHRIRIAGPLAHPSQVLRLMTIIKWICKMAKKPKFKCQLTCFLYKHPKQLPGRRMTMIRGEDVNSGMTVTATKHIYIWREEEIEKVLIHELLHALELDHHFWHKRWSAQFREKWGIDSNYYVAEAWCEATAVFYYQVFLRYCGVHMKLDDTIIRDETRHSKRVCCQILHHFGYKSFQDIINNPSRWQEDTNVWSYYICKYALMKSPYFWETTINRGLHCWSARQIDQCLRDIDKNILGEICESRVYSRKIRTTSPL
jgi:hypothetical protein